MEPETGAVPVVVQATKQDDTSKFLSQGLGAKYWQFQVQPETFPNGYTVVLKDSIRTMAQFSLNVKAVGTVQIAMIPVGTTDWNQADRMKVMVGGNAEGSASAISCEIPNYYKERSVAETGVNTAQEPISLLHLAFFDQAAAGTTTLKPNQTLSFVLLKDMADKRLSRP